MLIYDDDRGYCNETENLAVLVNWQFFSRKVLLKEEEEQFVLHEILQQNFVAFFEKISELPLNGEVVKTGEHC